MNKILNLGQAVRVSQDIRKKNRKIVLAGGVFDILHVGHIKFLKNAKKAGDVLFILLENDINVSKSKGKNRPINNQQDRAEILSELSCIDYVVALPEMKNDNRYDILISQLKPDIIATTKPDPKLKHKLRQVKLVGAELKYVIKKIRDKSTTRLLKLI